MGDAAQRISQWSASHPVEAPAPENAGCAQRLPVGIAGLPLAYVRWVPPGASIAQSALSHRTQADQNAYKVVRDAWDRRHVGIQAEHCPQLDTTRAQQVHVCHLAGFCLCSPRGREICHMAHAIQQILSALLKKGEPTRRLYDRSAAVLHVKPADPERQASFWYFLGYGNLQSGCFSLLPLRCMRVTDHGDACLAELQHEPAVVQGTTTPMNLWRAAAGWSPRCDWHLDIFRLHSLPEPTPTFPPPCIRARRLNPPISRAFWGNVPDARRLPVQRLPRPPPGDPDGAVRRPRPQNELQVRPPALVFQNVFHEVPDLFDEWPEGDGDRVDGVLGAVVLDVEKSDTFEQPDVADEGEWHVYVTGGRSDASLARSVAQQQHHQQQQSQERHQQEQRQSEQQQQRDGGDNIGNSSSSSNGSNNSGGGGGGGNADGNVAGRTALGDPGPPAMDMASTALAQPAAAPIAPAGIAGDASARRNQEREARVGLGNPWPTFDVPGMGKLVFDEVARSFGAHCSLHPTCRVNRVVAKRPIGYLVAWLRDGTRHTSRAGHFAARMERADGQALSLANRQAARNFALSLPSLSGALELEAPAPQGGPLEPLDLL